MVSILSLTEQRSCIFNPLVPNTPFLYLLKTVRFSDVFRGRGRVHWEQWVNMRKLLPLEQPSFESLRTNIKRYIFSCTLQRNYQGFSLNFQMYVRRASSKKTTELLFRDHEIFCSLRVLFEVGYPSALNLTRNAPF